MSAEMVTEGTPAVVPSSAILLVDLSSIAHPIWHTSASEPDPNATCTRIVDRVRSLATAHPHAAICVDSGKSFRAQIDPQYKANRPESDATLHHQIDLAVDVLKSDGFPVWAVRGFEADDIIATATSKALEREGLSVVIASADKDLLQLVHPRVRAKSLRDGSLVDEDGVVTKFGVLPHQMRDYLSLVGDTSDNIRGAKGIGPKRAAEILSTFGSLDSAYRAIDDGEAGFSPAIKAALEELRPRLETVRSLVTMRTDVPINFDEVLMDRVPKDAELPAFEEEDMEDAELTLVAPATVPTNGDGPAAPAAPAPSTAIAVRQSDVIAATPVEWERQLDPRSPKEALALAAHMHASRMFSGYGSPDAVLSTIMVGRELGLPAMASLRGIHSVEGRHMLAADLMRALVIRSGKAKYFRCTERTAERATFETQRGDDPPMSLTYTVAEATLAGVVKKDSGWQKNPADMCVARASAKLARLVYPDVCFSLYAKEEFEE